MCCCMIETSLVPPQKSSATFGNLRQYLENVWKRSSSLQNNFRKSSEIFGKWSEIFRKSSETSLLVCLYNKHYYTTQAVRGPITKINQSKCSIAGPIFSIGPGIVPNDPALVSLLSSVV